MSNKLVMYDHTYISKSIEDSRDADFMASNLYFTATIEDKSSGDVIRVPYLSLTQKYADILSQYVTIARYTEVQFNKYQYKPKLLSQDIYGTTELWFLILEANELHSTSQFNFRTIYLFRTDIVEKMTRILNLEVESKNYNEEEISSALLA